MGAVHCPVPSDGHIEAEKESKQDIYSIFPEIVIENKSTSIWRKYSSKKKTSLEAKYSEMESDHDNELNKETNNKLNTQINESFLVGSGDKNEDRGQIKTISKQNLDIIYNILETTDVIAENKENILREKNG